MTEVQIARLRSGLGSTPTADYRSDINRLIEERARLLKAVKDAKANAYDDDSRVWQSIDADVAFAEEEWFPTWAPKVDG